MIQCDYCKKKTSSNSKMFTGYFYPSNRKVFNAITIELCETCLKELFDKSDSDIDFRESR